MDLTVHEHIIRIIIITVSGRLDARTVGPFHQQQANLLDTGAQHFVLDLRDTTFIDSAGVAALVSLLKQARQAGGDLALVKPTDPTVHQILTLTRFDRVVPIADTLQDALDRR